jgi:hypothetical protein
VENFEEFCDIKQSINEIDVINQENQEEIKELIGL